MSARARRTLADVASETVAAVFLETAAGAPVVLTGTMAAPGYPPRAERYDAERGYQASFDGVIRHFVDCLETGAPFETDPADNLETLRLVEHAYWAAGLHDPTP